MSYDVYLLADLGGDEPVTLFGVLDWNYTSNCAPMWRLAMPPDGIAGFDGKTAGECIPTLVDGIADMRAHPEKYLPLNPSNGWGTFPGQLKALQRMLAGFCQAPNATIRVSY